jgi:cytochrome c556
MNAVKEGKMKKLVFSILLVIVTPCFAAESKTPSDPMTELNQMDKRTPVPLIPHMANHQKQNMREHLESVQEIIAGLMKTDYKAVETAASKMGLTPEMQQMCQRMGAGAAGFSEKAIQFHKSADQIAAFARKKDQKGVLNSLNRTLTQCTSCHATYRQQVVDEATYELFAEKLKTSK